MKKFRVIFILITLATMISCSTEIEIEKHINLNSPMTLSINKTNGRTGLTETETKFIQPKSESFNKLIDWAKTNKKNWRPDISSWATATCLTQGNFRLVYDGTWVGIGFTDNNGKPKQYVSTIKNGDLDFLIK
jgi:hypothetical protein